MTHDANDAKMCGAQHFIVDFEQRRRVTRGIRKADLPTKICPVCRRPFAWRKKWDKTWDEVRYCSERCRANRGTRDSGPATEPDPA